MYTKVIAGINGRAGGHDAEVLAAALVSSGGQVLRAQVSIGWEMESAGMVTVAALSVGAGLREVAQSHDSDLIVVGSCRRNMLERVLAGDDARSVLHHAPCPVAIAPAEYADGAKAIRTVGVAYDGTPESTVAVAHAALVAADLQAEVIALNVVAPPMPTVTWGMAGGYFLDEESLLASARKRIGALEAVKLEYVVGTINEELEAFSERVDLIVCGSRHHSAAARIVLGESGDYLARHAACPLLVTPSTDEATVARWHRQREAAVA